MELLFDPKCSMNYRKRRERQLRIENTKPLLTHGLSQILQGYLPGRLLRLIPRNPKDHLAVAPTNLNPTGLRLPTNLPIPDPQSNKGSTEGSTSIHTKHTKYLLQYPTHLV